MTLVSDVCQLIGKTPLVKLNSITANLPATVLVKLESFNPGGSVKDRLAFAMIKDGEDRGCIRDDTVIIEPTSGNTGVGLAMICAQKGYRLIVVMPENMSLERRRLIQAYGAELFLTNATEGMKGAIEKAEELSREIENAFMPMQFENQSNVKYHQETTAEEILKDTNGKLDVFVAGVGTGGTFTGISSVLKERIGNVTCVAVEPKDSAVLSGEAPGSHKIQGIGAGFVTKITDTELIDDIIKVDFKDAEKTMQQLAEKEGILCGISSGANVWAAMQLAQRPEYINRNIVTVICDTGERYLSLNIFNERNYEEV
ncbi:MAG: cysteine synthase A [Marinilabiliales bacterium]|nr:MAG: cysteine synthase A [Marinilabiliales bacterium]